MHLGSGIAVVDSITEPIKVLKILMEGLAPTKGAGFWIIRFQGLPIARSYSPFDLIYLDSEFRVLHTVEITQSSDFVPFKGIPSSALVLPSGSITKSKTFNGDAISLRPDANAPGAQELPAQLAALEARGKQAPVPSGSPAIKPRINITAAPPAKTPATTPEPGGVLRPAKKQDGAASEKKDSVPATPSQGQKRQATLPEDAVLRPPRHAPPVDKTPLQPAAATQHVEPKREDVVQPAANVPKSDAAPKSQTATAPSAAQPGAKSEEPAATTKADTQTPAVQPSAPQTAPAVPQALTAALPQAPTAPAETPSPGSAVAKNAPATAVTQPSPAPAPVSSPPAPPAVAPPAEPRVAASAAAQPSVDSTASQASASPPATNKATEAEPDVPTVVMHGAKLTQEELFKLLGADKAFEMVELAPEWPAPAARPRSREKQATPPTEAAAGIGMTLGEDAPEEQDQFDLEEENEVDAQIEQAAKKSQLKKTEAKLAGRWDVKLLYSLFPELHPAYRPEFQVPYIDFMKYINNPEEQDKLSMKIQVLSWLYPDLELETVEKRQREHRRAPRVADPGLVGFYFSSGSSEPHPVRNFSVWGFYMITDEKWLPGTIIRLTLQVVGTDGTNPGDALTVHARVVNWDKQGAGFEFVLPGFLGEDE